MAEPTDDDDERWLVVDGRRWRRTDPTLGETVVERLKSHLGRARNAVRSAKGNSDAVTAARARVRLAKTGLGERGPKWWERPEDERAARAADALDQLDEVAPPVD